MTDPDRRDVDVDDDLFAVIDMDPAPAVQRTVPRIAQFGTPVVTAHVPGGITMPGSSGVLVPVRRPTPPVVDATPPGDPAAPVPGGSSGPRRHRLVDDLVARAHRARKGVWQWCLWHLFTLTLAAAASVAAIACALVTGMTVAQAIVPAILAPGCIIIGAVVRPGPRPARTTARHRATADTPARTIVPARTSDTVHHRATTGS